MFCHIHSFTKFTHYTGFPHVLDFVFIIFKTLKVLENMLVPNFICEVLEIWVSRNVLSKYNVNFYFTSVHYMDISVFSAFGELLLLQ